MPVCTGVALLAASSLYAINPLPQNLGPGLDTLVSSRLAVQNAQRDGKELNAVVRAASGKQYASQEAADIANSAIGDNEGRVMVMIRLNGLSSFKKVRKVLEANIPSLTITATDKSYKAGVLEGYIDVDDAAKAATTLGVSNVMLESKPEHAAARSGNATPAPNVVNGQTLTLLGTAFDQGVTQHRVDTFNKFYNPSATSDYEGQNIQIGFISDSYDTQALAASPTPRAPTDVTNFDLPGAAGNPAGNTQPVVVLQDFAGGTDEGRAMVQIGYKMAPRARLAFATADNGEVGFGNNIRALAGIAGFTFPAATQQGFAADVICDDVGYQDEPYFEDGIIGNAVDDASAAGVAYFSSAGNDVGTYDYDSDFRYVPNGANALNGTNINLAGVPTALYQGGFHNFNPSGGQDVALTFNVIAGTSLPVTVLQWNDPYTQTVSINQPAIFTDAGSINGTTTTSVTFTTPTLTAGQSYAVIETADSGSAFDGIVSITDLAGNVLVGPQDTGTDETLSFTPATTAAYKVVVTAFSTTTGPFHVNVYTSNPSPAITTDFNVLVFDMAGNYLPNSSLVANNITNNVPYDAKRTSPATGQTQVQYVVSRSTVPTSTTPANHFRLLCRGNGLSGIGPAEYFTYNTPNTKGHAMARTCNGTAAYSVFRPSVPEYYTSPGPATIYFDKLSNRLATPEVRLQPSVAAADNASNSFFASDSAADLDTKPNFSGTSAAAPHAAAIAALVLQAHGGSRSLTPAQMTDILHRSAFPHDLDPNFASGVARVVSPGGSGKVTINVNSDLGLNPSAGAFNPNSISVTYVGPGSLATLTFNPAGAAATGGSTTGGNNGVDGATTSPVTYFSNIYPGIVFEPNTIPFTVGNGTSTGLTGTTAAFTNQAPAPSATGQTWTMTLTFPVGAFTGGNVLSFTVGHGPQHNSSVTGTTVPGTGPTGGATSTSFTQADLFGGSVLLPDGTGDGNGMSFSGTLTDGTAFTGVMKNRIGAGYSVQDGFGFINAQTAITQTVQ